MNQCHACEWTATDIIVYTCPEGHLDETTFCLMHLADWAFNQAQGNITCDQCGKPVILFLQHPVKTL